MNRFTDPGGKKGRGKGFARDLNLRNARFAEIKPLSTEGEGFSGYPDRKPYKLKQINFPIGVGLKYKLSPDIKLSVECVSRILNTDYLDDVSTNYIDKELFAKYFTGSKLTDVVKLNDRKHEIDPSLTTFTGEQRGNPNKNDSYFTINFKPRIHLLENSCLSNSASSRGVACFFRHTCTCNHFKILFNEKFR